MTEFLNCAGTRLDLSAPVVMGVLNVTPDSFSDGGRFDKLESARAEAEKMTQAGAAIIDVGGESTRPGAAAVSEQEELDRVIPVVEALAVETDAVISIDTSKAVVMREATLAGARLINDVRALELPGALEAAAQSGAAVCLMHRQGEPGTMQDDPAYDDVVAEVKEYLRGRVESALAAGIKSESVAVDPGFGFGKTLQHNYQLLASLSEFADLGVPLLVGMSRKSMFGKLLDLPVDERLNAGLAAAAIAAWQGARIIRTHDVRATREALAVCTAALNERREPSH